MTLLSPLAGLVGLALALPLVAAVLGVRRADAVRRALRLPPPERRSLLVRPALAAAGIALVGLAAAQPALTRTTNARIRNSVQAIFVVDTSRSMAASSTRHSSTRLDRAVAAAVALRNDIPDVEAGISTLTDRVLPDLLPVPDREGFDAVMRRTVAIESPPPQHTNVRATDYSALAGLVSGNAFTTTASRRIVVLLTDGESVPVSTSDLARTLSPDRGYRFLALQFWRPDESVYDADGRAEAAYRPDPSSRATLRALADALGGRSYDESRVAQAGSYLRGLGDTGPTVAAGAVQHSRVPLAPYVALVGMLALLASFAPSHSVRRGLRLIVR